MGPRVTASALAALTPLLAQPLVPLLAATMALAPGCGPKRIDEHVIDAVPATITVDRHQRFQTMVGWSATAQAGQGEPGFDDWSGQLLDLAVGDLGINRLRLTVASGLENRTGPDPRRGANHDPVWRCRRYLTVNDNDDPHSIAWEGFHLERLDETVRRVVLPIKRRLEARGEKLYLNLQYGAFISQCKEARLDFDYVHARPDEYAEYILAIFLHLQEAFGLTPDGIEVINEPDNGTGWTGERIGRAMVATSQRLAAAGFHPEFIAPGTMTMEKAARYVDELVAVPGARQLLAEISYHRYGSSSRHALEEIAARAKRLGVRTSMQEHIGADVEELYVDLGLAQVSSWQQFTLAYPTKDNGAQYYPIIGGKPVLGSRSRYLRQYFRYVRAGAVRIGATSDRAAVRAIAFENPGERLAVVVHLARPAGLVVRGLSPGAYGASLTTETETGRELGELSAAADGTLRLSAPGAGVLTLHALSATQPDR